ncbi:hypothetical protein OPT61_g1311 [Boeremia exigua]|uniref:Uncharacterized protein n=1 Tax=Boeremia exigua TaxID=749465 RepID=A0ACC2IR09_9PLEO|nr:hypothetical protein OPT61_g1311 [Boeremia exigua]
MATGTLPQLPPQSERLLAMLRYHTSLDFHPSVLPPDSATLTRENSEPLSTTQQSESRNTINKLLSDHSTETRPGQSRLESLLDFVRWTNERDRASVTLDTFLSRIQNERDEVEAALKEKTSIAAANFISSLILSLDSDASGSDSKNDANNDLCRSDTPEEIATSESLAVQQSRLPPCIDMVDTPVWTRGQDTERIRQTQRTTKAIDYDIIQQGLNSQSITREKLHVGVGDFTSDGVKDLVKELQLGCKTTVKTSEEGPHQAELLLRSLAGSAPLIRRDPQQTCQIRDANSRGIQTESVPRELETDPAKVSIPVTNDGYPGVETAQGVNIYKAWKSVNDAKLCMEKVRVSLPKSMGRSPMLAIPTETEKTSTLAKRSAIIEPLSSVETRPSFSACPPTESATEVNNTKREGEVRNNLQKKPQSARPGPDQFLSLLDLVRKK